MAMDPTVKVIRRFLKAQDAERTHVRVYSDGETWVFAPTSGFADDPNRFARRDALSAAFNAAGFVAQCTGLPGTSGEGIITIRALPLTVAGPS